MQPFFRLLILTVASGLAMAGDISLPLFFIPNHGLTDSRFRYLAQTPSLRASFAKDSIALQLPASQIRLRFQGANSDVELLAGDPLKGQANFFGGASSEQWHTSLPTVAEIRYRGLYPGRRFDLSRCGARGSQQNGREQRAKIRISCGCRSRPRAHRSALHRIPWPLTETGTS